MTFMSSTVTGAAATGLTSPTYTLTPSTAPDVNGKAVTISALGGTQTGVAVNTVDKPFTMLLTWPKVFKTMVTQYLALAGLYPSLPTNKVTLTTKKAVGINGSAGFGIMFVQTTISVPVGAADQDPVQMAAALSCHIGELSANVDGITNILAYAVTP